MLRPDARPHRQLPEKLDLPADVYNVAPRDLEEVLDDIVVVARRDDVEGDAGGLEDAINDIFKDWAE
jgi:hypothetical protein